MLKTWAFALLVLVILVFPGLLMGFHPSNKLAIYSMYFGVIITIIFFPFSTAVSKSTNYSGIKYYSTFIVLPLGIALVGYGVGISSLGFMLNRVIGDSQITTQVVKRKGCITRREWCCSTKIHVTTNANMSTGGLCVEDQLWNKLEVGQHIKLTGVSSYLGFDVDKIEIIR